MNLCWSQDNSRKIPVFRADLAQNQGHIVVQKAHSWFWVGILWQGEASDHNHSAGFRTSDEAKDAAQMWVRAHVQIR